MKKADAVAALGATPLLAPGRVRAALGANDRLKLGLTVLQAALAHAESPEAPLPDLSREIAAAGLAGSAEGHWLRELPAEATLQATVLHLPGLPRLMARLCEDLATMGRPLQDDASGEAAHLQARRTRWQTHLAALGAQGEQLALAEVSALTHGQSGVADSLHLLVMDLHKAINRLAARLATQAIDGAHVWQLDDARDPQQVAAFMRGINRTRHLKLDHPGLDTAATRDGERLMIQNDIGTNDAHVLVLQVVGQTLHLTYSDLHRQRFDFFKALLDELGPRHGRLTWGQLGAQRNDALNEGKAYTAGTAQFETDGAPALEALLEAIGARIVFLIDWNRARKRLLSFVDKSSAVRVLTEAARREVGHMAWLAAGGERLLWQAMADIGGTVFHLGDRLDDVLGASAAQDLLVEVLSQASQAARRQQPVALVADETRLALARALQGRHTELALLAEHAGLTHALAQALRDGLAHGGVTRPDDSQALAARAKVWERQADHLVMRARAHAERLPAWQALARLMEQSDDVIDALEEGAFLLSLVADGHGQGWGPRSHESVQALADAVLGATQDLVKALAIAQAMGDGSDATDHDDFVAATWRVLQAERRCDDLLRAARRALAAELHDAAALLLATDLAIALEKASDGLLALVYGVRARSFRRVEAML
jgi:uncharacterized protein Yka (UPF0111/DUF47 family)